MDAWEQNGFFIGLSRDKSLFSEVYFQLQKKKSKKTLLIFGFFKESVEMHQVLLAYHNGSPVLVCEFSLVIVDRHTTCVYMFTPFCKGLSA